MKKNLCKLIIFAWLVNLQVLVFASSEAPISYLNASELLELYSSMHSSINSMSVSYTDVVEEALPDPKAPNEIKTIIRFQKVERIEEGDKYHIRYYYSKDPNGFEQRNEIPYEHAFDGSVTMEYFSKSKSGRIVPGRTQRDVESMNHLLKYMLIETIVFKNGSKLHEYYPNGTPSITFMVDPQGTVRQHLEQISGQWCHVVDTICPPIPGQPKGASTTVWFAAEKGGLPMKFEEYDGHGKCIESMIVKKVAAVDDKVSNVWYPQEAIKTTSLAGVGILKHRFVCHELRVNVETNKDTWKFPFPVGTDVLDRVLGISYKTGPGEITENESMVQEKLVESEKIPLTPETKDIETNIGDEPNVPKASTEPNKTEVQSEHDSKIPIAASNDGNRKRIILTSVVICLLALLASGGCLLLWKKKND